MTTRCFFQPAFAILLGLLVTASPATAFQTGATGDAYTAVETVGKAYQPLADEFGCAVFASGNLAPGGNVLSLAYVPAGDKPEAWTRLFSVTVFALPEDPKTAPGALTQIMDGLLSNAKERGKVINSTSFRNAQGEPGAFLEYEIGEGLLKEHNVGIFIRTSDKTAAFLQVQARGKRPFDPADATKILGLVDKPKTEVPAEKDHPAATPQPSGK